MHPVCSLLLLVGSGPVGHDTVGRPDKAAVGGEKLLIVKHDPHNPVVLENVLQQVTENPHSAVSKSAVPVLSIQHGLEVVRKASKEPVLAAVEVDGWFFYGTVVLNHQHGRPGLFISGYAIRRGGQDVIGFSVW